MSDANSLLENHHRHSRDPEENKGDLGQFHLLVEISVAEYQSKVPPSLCLAKLGKLVPSPFFNVKLGGKSRLWLCEDVTYHS